MPRPRAWGDRILQFNLTGTTQVNLDLLSELADADTKTVVRVVGHMTFVPNDDPSAGITVLR